ncbi:MAG: type transport system permease protein [Acidobacteriota bacterium]|jgi:ABC-2 type transport system permease protein|nr:type transport system permease protein [Acidobacteriota bacterium]
MNKMFAVLKREYLQAVRKKAFIIMTLLFPFLMLALMAVPALVASKGMGEKKIAVLDGTGLLRQAFARPNAKEKTDPKKEARDAMSGRRRGPELPSQLLIDYHDQAGSDVKTDAKPYLTRLAAEGAQKLDGVFIIPAGAKDSPDTQLTYYSRSSTDVMTQERLARLTNKAMQRNRLAANGIHPEDVDRLTLEMPVEAVQISKSGEQKTGGEMNFLFGFVFAALLILPSFIYGNETMRGIVQEKSERVVEVLISSVTPTQLLMGKILGVAAVGLTQIGVWLIMGSLAGAYGAATASMAGINVAQFFRPSIFVFFFIFFILAYLTYVCVYAIAGAVSNTEKEAQQFVAPISMVMMAPWFLMFPIIMNPDSKIAVGFSLAPVFGPITMFVRTLVAEPPMWHIVVSIAVSIATIFLFMWITAKIFRVGILSYGKRPTIPELWRWLKVA